NQPQAQLGEREARHFVGDDDVAAESQLEPTAETHTVNGADGDERCGIDGVEYGVDAFKKLPYGGETFLFGERFGTAIEFAEVGARGEALLTCAGEDAGGGFRRES